MADVVRTHFSLPKELVGVMDKLVGKGRRTSLLIEILAPELKRRRLLQLLSDEAPLWKDEDHPELKEGAYAYVRKMRDEDDKRSRKKLGDWLSPKE
jgi:hypothetical protein